MNFQLPSSSHSMHAHPSPSALGQEWISDAERMEEYAQLPLEQLLDDEYGGHLQKDEIRSACIFDRFPALAVIAKEPVSVEETSGTMCINPSLLMSPPTPVDPAKRSKFGPRKANNLDGTCSGSVYRRRADKDGRSNHGRGENARTSANLQKRVKVVSSARGWRKADKAVQENMRTDTEEPILREGTNGTGPRFQTKRLKHS